MFCLGIECSSASWQVFDLVRHPGPVEKRLDRIEMLLSQLVAAGSAPRTASRTTLIDEPSPAPVTKKVEKVGEQKSSSGDYTPEPGHSSDLPNNSHGQHTPFVGGAAGAGPRKHIDE